MTYYSIVRERDELYQLCRELVEQLGQKYRQNSRSESKLADLRSDVARIVREHSPVVH